MSESRLPVWAGLIVLVSVGLSAGVALAITKGAASPAAVEPDPASSGRLALLERANRALQAEVTALRRRLDTPVETKPSASLDAAAVERAVAGWFTEHGGDAIAAWMKANQPNGGAVAARAESTADAPTREDETDLMKVFADLQGKNLWLPESQSLIAKLAKAGKLEDLVAVFRKHAKANPQDATAQAALGSMLLQACDHCPSDSEKGRYAEAADDAFDRALDVDPQHWEARFTKALAYTFWPAFTGKPAEAVTQFETLIKQQERQRPEPHHAQSYLYLGNLHLQRGDRKKAEAIWGQGLRLFPNDPELRKKLP